MTQFIPAFMKGPAGTSELDSEKPDPHLERPRVREVVVLSDIMRLAVAWAIVRRIRTGQTGSEAVDKYIVGFNEFYPEVITEEQVKDAFQEFFSTSPQEFYRTHWKK